MLKNLTISRFLSDYEHVFHVKLWENCLLQIELEQDFSCMNTHVLFPISALYETLGTYGTVTGKCAYASSCYSHRNVTLCGGAYAPSDIGSV